MRKLRKEREICKMTGLCLIISLVLGILPTQSQASVKDAVNETMMDVDIPEDAYMSNGHAYKKYNMSTTWQEARLACENMGGHLATITSEDEQQIIEALLKNQGEKNCYWIGGYKENNQWKWINGEPFNFSNWDYGEPNGYHNDEYYIEIYGKEEKYELGKWNDMVNEGDNVSSSWHKLEYTGFICEWDDGGISEELPSNQPMPSPVFSSNPIPQKTERPLAEKIQDAMPDLSNLGNAELKGPEISIGSNTFSIFKADMSMSLPLFKDIDINVNETDHTAEILIGFAKKEGDANVKNDPDDPYWRESYKEVKSFVQKCGGKVDTTKLWNQFSKLRGKLKKIDAEAAFHVSGNEAGYLKLQLDESGNITNLIEGGLAAGFEASAKTKVPLWWIVYSEFGIAGSADGKLYLTTENMRTLQPKGELSLTLKPSVALGADAVVVDVKGGLEGELGGKIEFPWNAMQKSLSAWLTGKVFVKVDTVVPGLSGSKDWNFPKMELYPNFGQISPQSINNFNYSRSEEATVGEIRAIKLNSAGAVDSTKDALCYENAKPQMLGLEDGRILMTYLDDTQSETDGQARLVYRLYDNGMWSEEKLVHSDGGLDMRGKLCVQGSDVFLLYENSSCEIMEGMSEKEILNSMDLYAVAFDTVTDEFSRPVRLGETSDTVWKYGYDFVRSEDELHAVWAENSENNVLLESGDTKIYQSRRTEEGWQEKELLVSAEGAVTEFVAREKNKAVETAYIKDGALYIDGMKVKLPGEKADSIQVFENIFYVRVDGWLYSYEDELEPVGVTCTSSYQVEGNAVYWTVQDNFKSEIYRQELSGKKFPVAVTDDGGYIGGFSVLARNGEKPALAYTFQQVDDALDGNPYGLTILKFTKEPERSQAEVTNVAWDVLSFMPGEENEISVTVQNTGTTELNNVKVIISDQEGNVLYEGEIAQKALPGESIEQVLSVPIPTDFTAGDVQVSLSALEKFQSEEKAESQIELWEDTADLQISAVNENTIQIFNAGEQDAKEVVLCIKDGTASGTTLRKENLGELVVGENAEYSVSELWKQTTANEYTEQNYLYCEVSQQAEEYRLWDNTLQMQKATIKIKEKESPSPVPSTFPSEEASEKPAVSPLPGVLQLPVPGLGNLTPQELTPTSIAAPGQVKGLFVKGKGKSRKASWKKMSSADGYQLCYSTSKRFKKKKNVLKYKLTWINKTTIKGLKKKKTYYFRVRAYRIDGGRKVWGKWSAVKRVRIGKK